MSYTKDLSRGMADSNLFHQISCTSCGNSKHTYECMYEVMRGLGFGT